MDKIAEQLKTFSYYAKQVLNEQEDALNILRDGHLLSGKLARMKVFNQHMEVLKEKLQIDIEERLVAWRHLPGEEYDKLSAQLSVIYADCINEYMCIPFIRD